MSDQSNWLASLFRNPLSGLEPSWRKALQTPAVSVLIALLIAQLVTALVLIGNAMPSAAPDAPLLDLSAEQVRRIELSSADGQVLLARAPEGWTVPTLADFPADADKVGQLLSTLTALQRPLPVGSSSEAQRRLKVADDNAERRISLSGDAGERVQILTGESPGFRRVYARLAGEDAVYDLPLASFQITSDADNWVRHDQLRLDAETIEHISSDDWTLSRSDGNWQLLTAREGSTIGLPTSASEPEPGPARSELDQPKPDHAEPPRPMMGRVDLDQAQVAALLSRIANLSYQGIRLPASEAPKGTDAGPAGGTAIEAAARLESEPVLRLNIGLDDGSSRSRTVFADGNDNYRLQNGSDPWLYELSEYDLEGLLGLDPQQLLASRAGESTAAAANAELNPVDATSEKPSSLDSRSAPTIEPKDSPTSNTSADALAEPPMPPSDQAPEAESAEESATASERQSAPETRAGISPASSEPDFRPQQRPAPARSAPPQWPYPRYAPPSGQPWPPQGPPPQAAPGWR